MTGNEDTVGESSYTDVVVLKTTKGEITIGLDGEKAPITVKNFIEYVESGHYDGTVFHRVIPTFMIQGGGFTSDARQKKTRTPIRLESTNGLSNKRGTIAMARTNEPNSATSQFFINVVDNDNLDNSPGNPGYAVFGQVISGMDVVERIRTVKTTTRGFHRDWPEDDIVIEQAYVK
ncbi:peptidylprolyl isomerase [Candidatus Altiarchaeota archaeon]